MKVEIKERKLTAGNRSLYLEYYETGFRKKENLHLYLVPDDAPNAKRLNEQTYNRAREIQAQRILNPPTFESKKKPEENQRAKTMTWLGWCDEYLQCAIEKGDCKKMIQHKGVVRKRIAAYLKRANRTDILLKEVDRDMVSGLFRYMREYRNPSQIKSNGGKLADFTLVLFEETVKAIFNKAVREALPKLTGCFQVLHICGKGNLDAEYEGTKNYHQYEYLDEELKHAYACADVLISRAGSNALCEILALKKPALLIPYPKGASRGDQILNANSFQQRGLSRVLMQEDMTPDTLVDSVINNVYKKRGSLHIRSERPAGEFVDQ